MLGELLSAGTKLLGGFLDRSAAKKQNEMVMAENAANRQMQLDFAKQGIQWKVADAIKAGVHPLFAMGASTATYAPQSIGSLQSTSMGSALSDMGQDISRAMSAKSTGSERATMAANNALVIDGMKLDNDIKRAELVSKVKKLAEPAVGPPLPEDTPDKRAIGFVGGNKMTTEAGTSNVDDFWQKRYGEPGEWVGAPVVAWQDFKQYMKNKSAMDLLRQIDASTGNPDMGNIVTKLRDFLFTRRKKGR